MTNSEETGSPGWGASILCHFYNNFYLFNLFSLQHLFHDMATFMCFNYHC